MLNFIKVNVVDENGRETELNSQMTPKGILINIDNVLLIAKKIDSDIFIVKIIEHKGVIYCKSHELEILYAQKGGYRE